MDAGRDTKFPGRHASEGWHLRVVGRTGRINAGDPSFRWSDDGKVLVYRHAMARGGWVYIMTNKPGGVLYTGVTALIAPRVQAHKEDRGSAFCRRYGLKTLVYAEQHDDIVTAIEREKAIKAWKRDWKIELIEGVNPSWRDLYDDLA